MTQPTVISTFAGCGGSSLGYKLAGFHELLALEWDDNAVETFKLNFPGVPVYHGDIAKLTGAECMKLAGVKVGELDVFDGSPPCQGFSTAGKRKFDDSPPCQGFSTAGKRKFDDPRNSLFKEFARLLVELQPKVFVMENVTGMVKGCMKQAYLTIIATLRDCGYVCKGEVLNAMYYNVPQSRERVIIIGVRKDLGIAPTHPKPQTRPCGCRRLDESPARCSPRRYGDVIEKEGKPVSTISKIGRKFWTPSLEFGRKSYIAAASFPDSFDIAGSLIDVKARIGNSVPPNLMRAIAEHIRTEILDKVRV